MSELQTKPVYQRSVYNRIDDIYVNFSEFIINNDPDSEKLDRYIETVNELYSEFEQSNKKIPAHLHYIHSIILIEKSEIKYHDEIKQLLLKSYKECGHSAVLLFKKFDNQEYTQKIIQELKRFSLLGHTDAQYILGLYHINRKNDVKEAEKYYRLLTAYNDNRAAYIDHNIKNRINKSRSGELSLIE